MKSEFKMEFRHSAGNLHLHPQGRFNGMGAWVLYKAIRKYYPGSGRVFVDTSGLHSITSSGVGLFRELMKSRAVPPDRLYLKGEKGFDMAPDGSRVLICNPEKNRRKSDEKGCPLKLCAGKLRMSKN